MKRSPRLLAMRGVNFPRVLTKKRRERETLGGDSKKLYWRKRKSDEEKLSLGNSSAEKKLRKP